MLSYLPSIQGFIERSKTIAQKQFRDLTDFFKPSHEEKPEKDNANDITAISLTKTVEDIEQVNQRIEDTEEKPSSQGQQQKKSLTYYPCFAKKSHSNALYFYSNGTMLSEEEGKQQFQEQQSFTRKRCRHYEVQSFQQKIRKHHKKYISNEWIAEEREEGYSEINLFLARQSIKTIQEQSQNNIIKVILRPKQEKSIKHRKEGYVHTEDLPAFGSFHTNYSYDQLRSMAYRELSSVSGFTVQNQWGRIEFLQPVDLYKKKLEKCLIITYNSVKILESTWKSKRIRLTIYNKALINEKNLQKIKENAASLGLKSTTYRESIGTLTFTY